MLFTIMFSLIWFSSLWNVSSYEAISYDELNLVHIGHYSNCSQVCQISYLKYESIPIKLDNSKISFSYDNKTKIEDGLCTNARELVAENLYDIILKNNQLEIILKDNTECKGLEFSAKIAETNLNLSEILKFRNSDDDDEFKLTEIINHFKINPNYTYEMNVKVKSLIDPRPFTLGTYLIKPDFILSNERIKFLDESLVLSVLTINFTNIWFFKHSMYSPKKTIDSLIILLKENENNSISKLNISVEDLAYDVNEPVPLKIENLKENTRYNLRVIANRQGYSIVSSLISFRTIRMPEFHVKAVNSTSVLVTILADCRSIVYEYDLNLYFSHIISNCRSYTLKYRKSKSSEYIFYANVMPFKYDSWSDAAIYERKIYLNHLEPDTEYEIKIFIQYYEANINFFKSVKTFTQLNYKRMLILMNIVFCSAIIFVLIILKRRRIGFMFYRAFGKNVFINQQNELSVNLLYDWNKLANRKFLLNELQNLRKIKEKSLEISQKVGTGAFGEVFEGKMKLNIKSKQSAIRVAIKRLKMDANDSEKLDLLREAIALNSFNHENLVKFYGVCFPKSTFNKFEIKYIVLEFMNSGDLLSYLRQCRARKESLEFKKAFKICKDIASGCRYLERLKFVHRDLAARNCLINVEKESIIVKLADFGLARELYTSYKKEYYKQIKDVRKLLPIRWMAPESLRDGVYTTKTDVWSYGIVVWEIITLGFLPYTGMNNLECVDFIINGGTLKTPSYCPKEIERLLSKCWGKKSSDRPSFEDIVKYLILVEDNSDNFEKFTGLYQCDDILNMDKKKLEHSSKNSDELTTSINSEFLDSKENTITNESMSSDN